MILAMAKAIDMEPDMYFRLRVGAPTLRFVRYEPIVSRFPGKRRGRVIVERGDSFVTEWNTRFLLVEDQ